ncbi:MAG: VCBS repeat-containing protein, partial [Candidatus Omnitrophica bacterium]|nr:VCBS repeat-containing protein [Candidatus Omnitrophota bacterium]
MSLTLTLLQSTQAVDKSGVSPNTISLPSGPGSIEGLGEDFQPHLNTGTSSYRVPLRVPNGTAGHTPELALVYEGGSGNSCLGIGWSLSIPSVRRQCEKGLPRYEPNAKDDDFDGLTDEADEEDRFLDTQGEELLLTDRGYYFPEKQEQFIRWRKVDSHWKAEQPNGDVWEFGRSGDARVESQGRIYRWCLDRQEDTNGNVIEYKYTRFQDSPNENQTYLTEIRYGPGSPPWSAFYTIVFEYETRPDTIEDYRSGFVVRTGLRMRKIHMALQGTVNEAESIGSLDPNGHRIGDINQDGVKDALIRVYEFKYEAHPHWSVLTSITTVGADGVSTLPPATFAYQRFLLPSVVSANGSTILSENEPTSVMDTGHSDLVDLNGDGLPDILRTEIAGGGHTGYLNLGPALENHLLIRWDSGIEVDATANSGQAWLLDLNSDQVHLADMDGDGLADLVSNPPQNQNPHYFRNTGKNGWGPRETMTVGDDIPPAPFGNPDVRTTDLNFDKNIDIVQSIPNGYRVWYNLGKDRETGIARYGERILTPGAIHEDTVIQFSESGTQLADLNGDRLSDVARIRPTSVIFCPSIGYGMFDSSTVVPIPTDNGLEHDAGFSFLDTEQIQRARLIDINGDGLADLVVERAAPREVWCWENLGNRSFAERRVITDLPANFGFMVDTRWADINGNGTDDLIYADSNLENGERIRVVDIGMALNGVPCPNILSSIENGIGRRILIQHRPTTFFAALDRSEGNPWTHTVPNPTAVVHRIIVEDGLGHHYTTEIMYHEGYYDGVEKEFRGFARSEQLDFGDDSQPTLVSEHHFDVGDTAEALKGKTLRVVRKNTMGQVFDEEITEWSTRVLHTVSELPDSLLAPTQVTFPFPVVKRQIIREEPTGPSDPVILESEFAHDDYGNKVMEANYGRVEGGNRGAGDDERITRTVFSATPEARIWSAPVDTVVTDDSTPPRLVGRNQAYYDGPPHVGLPLGSITKGNLSRARDWVGPENPPNPPDPLPEPPERFLQVNTNPDNTLSFSVTDEDLDRWIHTTRNQYDSFGNVLSVADPLAELTSKGLSPATGHFRNLTYDPVLHTYPTHEEIFTGDGNTLLIEVGYDLAFGTIIRSIDFNGYRTDYGYDPFSRITAIAKPGGSPRDTLSMPTLGFTYILAADVPLGATQGTVNWIETRMHEQFGDPNAYFVSRKFIDGLGREILSKEEDEQPGRTVVKSAKTFNARRTEFQSILPFYSNSGLDFEWIEGPGWTGTWLIDGQEQVLELDQAPRNRMFYDATGREIRMLQPDEAFTRTEYLPLVRRVLDEEDTNPASTHYDTPMVYHTDGLSRLVGVDEVVKINDDGTPRVDPVAWRTTYNYDLLDNLIRITDSQNNIKTIQYDAIKRKTYMDDPDRGRMWYRYDDATNLIESVDAKGQRITYTYDGTNRLRTEDYHDEGMPHSANRAYNPLLPIGDANQPDVAYHYDAPAPGGPIDLGDATFGTAENLLGFLSYVVDLSGEEHNSYDERGNVRWVVKRIPDPPTGILVSYKTEMAYDAADRAVALIYPDNDRVTYTYNARNLPESIPGILNRIDYAPSSQTIEMLCGNGVQSGYKYDRRIRLSHLSHISTNQSNQPLVDYAYEFDGASNITAIHDLRPAEEVPLDSERRNTQLFEYDRRIRLSHLSHISTNQSNQPLVDYAYEFDGASNITAIHDLRPAEE